jgi:hypothetical protein
LFNKHRRQLCSNNKIAAHGHRFKTPMALQQ